MRKWIIGLATGLVAALALVAPASPASASVGHCPDGQTQIAQGTSSASVYQCIVYSQHLPGSCTNLSGSWNDATATVTTGFGSGYGLRLWLNANCTTDGWPGPSEGEDYLTVPHMTYTYLGDDERACQGGAYCGTWLYQASSYSIVLA